MDPHGYVELIWQQNVLIVKTHGPFNLEGVKIAYDDIVKTVESKGFDSWHRVDFLDNHTLGSPDVMKVIGKSYKGSCSSALCKSVSVCCSTALQFFMMEQFVKEAHLAISVFDNEADANALIASLK